MANHRSSIGQEMGWAAPTPPVFSGGGAWRVHQDGVSSCGGGRRAQLVVLLQQGLQVRHAADGVGGALLALQLPRRPPPLLIQQHRAAPRPVAAHHLRRRHHAP